VHSKGRGPLPSGRERSYLGQRLASGLGVITELKKPLFLLLMKVLVNVPLLSVEYGAQAAEIEDAGTGAFKGFFRHRGFLARGLAFSG